MTSRASAPALTWDQVRSWRLARQRLTERAGTKDLAAAAGAVCGIHAQIMSAAELSLAARVDGLTVEDVRSALWKKRTLVKTWAMRGTLHLFPAADVPLYVAALGLRLHGWAGAWLRHHGITAKQADEMVRAAGDALEGRCLTREELADAVASRAVPRLRDRLASGWGDLLKPAAYAGNLCFGPSRGQKITFVRPADWLGSWRKLDGDEAMREVARRFLRTYGPATPDDFGRWWGTARAPARRILEQVAGLVEVEVEGRRSWAAEEDVDAIAAAAPPEGVHLLPNFDCYVVGYRPREDLVADPFTDRIFGHPAGFRPPVVLVGGRIAGVWDKRQRGRRVEIQVEPFARFTAAIRKGIEAEAGRFGALLGAEVEVSYPP